MPMYDYQCVNCGSFTGWTSMSQATMPIPCPACSVPSQRVISAPHLMRMNANVRKAMSRNERAAHEPVMVRRVCGCSGPHSCRTKASTGVSSTPANKAASPLQMQTTASARPWMLGH